MLFWHNNKKKHTMKKIILITILSSFLFASCQKDINESNVNNSNVENMDDLKINSNFNFKTTQVTNFNLKTLDFAGKSMPNVRIDIMTDYSENNGALLSSGMTDQSGNLKLTREIPSYFKEIVLSTKFLGYPREIKVDVVNGIVNYTYGGIIPNNKSTLGEMLTPKSTNANFSFLGTYNSNGVPSYLLTNDVFDNLFLSNVNSTLPEQQAVPTYNPQYITQGTETDVKLNEACDVWVTFVAEGAGYKNVLGFYTYNLNNPPTSSSQINTINVVFPNASMTNSGGGLNPGNKVKIGTFAAGTGIGWVLVADGWKNGTVTNGNHLVYSNPAFNPETNPTLKRHNVFLFDQVRSLFLIGFEDMRRDLGSDNDFNDLVFYVKSNPITAIDNTNTPPVINTLPDTDGDGVSDPNDDYPTDPAKAFNNYYPNKNTFGTLAYEDLWPSKGDYDFNDVIVDYRFNQITNAQSKVVKIEGKMFLKATGAGYQNGFGFEMPIPASNVSNATGSQLKENYINIASNGMESGQNNAVFIAFDNAYKMMKNVTSANQNGNAGINTSINGTNGNVDTMNIVINLVQPTDLSTIGYPPYNPFIIVNKNRAVEVHLADKPNTLLANIGLFGTINDNTLAPNRYYKTINNLPWALNIAEGFDYPTEKTQIISAYNYFAAWAQSNGTLYNDWYKNINTYRNSNMIYHK
jgi:LruC domain-containing protein